MNRWINFNINHPLVVLFGLLVITVIAGSGIRFLYFDSRTEALMPREDAAYKMGERAKKVFGDIKTYMVVVVEPFEGEELFSYKLFSHINNMVEEIEEFRNFDYLIEEERLQVLVNAANVSVTGLEQKTESIITSDTDFDDLESALDSQIFGGDDPESMDLDFPKLETPGPWDLSEPLECFYAESIRDRQEYSYSGYRPVTLELLRRQLDTRAGRQLDTILRANKLDNIEDTRPLSVDEFKKILETWETVYLYKSMEIVKSFMNPVSGEDVRGDDNTLTPVDLLPLDENNERILPKNRKEFAEYREILELNPSYEFSLYSLDKSGDINSLAMSIIFRPLHDHYEITSYIYGLVEKYNRAPVVLTSAGLPVLEKYIQEYMLADLLNLLPVVFFVIILTFVLNFRIARGVFLPTLAVLIGAVWTLGLMGYLGIPITIVVNLLPPLLVVLGSSYSIHIFNQYLHDLNPIRKEGLEALKQSMYHIAGTIMLAALTTCIAFLTLTSSQIVSLRDFGMFAAAGTVFFLIISVTLIPSSLALMKHAPKKNKMKIHDNSNIVISGIINFLSRLSLNRPGSCLLVGSLFIMFFSLGISMLRVESADMHMFKKDSYVYQSDIAVGKLYRGTITSNLVIDSGSANGVKNPEFLKTVEEIRDWITSEEGQEKYHQLHTVSFGDVIKRMHKAFNGDDPDYYVIPDDELTIADYLEIYSGEDRNSDGRPDAFEPFVDTGYRYVNIIIRVGSVGDRVFTTAINKKGIERIGNYMADHPTAGNYEWYLLGELTNFMVIANLIVKGQLTSIILSMIIVFFVIALLFRNFKAAIVGIIPISTSIILVYGLMGYMDIPLDIPKALLAAVAIGIGVDDTIHMFNSLRYHLSKGVSIEEAIVKTHKSAGHAITYTSIALIFGFGVLMSSQFLPVFYLGWLVASIIAVTTIGALVLIPAAIIFFKVSLDPQFELPRFKGEQR